MHHLRVLPFTRHPEQSGLSVLPGQCLAETLLPTVGRGLGAVSMTSAPHLLSHQLTLERR